MRGDITGIIKLLCKQAGCIRLHVFFATGRPKTTKARMAASKVSREPILDCKGGLLRILLKASCRSPCFVLWQCVGPAKFTSKAATCSG